MGVGWKSTPWGKGERESKKIWGDGESQLQKGDTEKEYGRGGRQFHFVCVV